MSTADAPARRYRIAEVARLSGFTPSALRFYEEAVLAPPARSPAGYRLYDDRDVERLRLVARAKQLGCTLEEIAGLVQAWEADECEPVKHRLRALVAAKVRDVEQHVVEQAALADQLRSTAAALADRVVDGPCDESCGCGDVAARPERDAPAIACSLGGDDMAARVEEWKAVLADVTVREPLPGGVRLSFATPAAVGEVARLAAAEHECCSFFAFAITVGARGTALEVTAPPEGRPLLEAVFGPAA